VEPPKPRILLVEGTIRRAVGMTAGLLAEVHAMLSDPNLNYNHLHYFWMVARMGSVAAAAKQLHVTPPTISAQLRVLQRRWGCQFFRSSGRGLTLTPAGQLALRYCDEMFSLGDELWQALSTSAEGESLSLRVGVADSLPKLAVYQLLRPAFRLQPAVHLTCIDGPLVRLIDDLAMQRLDIVLADAPSPTDAPARLYCQLLGETSIGFFAAESLLEPKGQSLVERLTLGPLLLPTVGSNLRRTLDAWFDELSVRPRIAHEIADSGLLKVLGQAGEGIFPAPISIAEEVCRQYHVQLVGEVKELRERYYAIGRHRHLKHPAIRAVRQAAAEHPRLALPDAVPGDEPSE
jgi:LysR family transcriptional activator of nhaA